MYLPPSEDLLQRIVAFMHDENRIPVEAWELALGVIAVMDDDDDIDIFFERARCEFSDPDLWGPRTGLPEGSTSGPPGVGRIQGFAYLPPMHSLDDAKLTARRSLTFIVEGAWHTTPFHLSLRG
jgi:hypothetical protein